MDQNENKNYNFENDPGQTQPGSAGAENQQGTQDVYGQQGAQGAYCSLSRTWQRIAE